MNRETKIKSGTKLFVIIISVAAIFVFKACSAHDTYTQFDEAMGFKNAQVNVVVFLQEHYNVTSYSSGGGSTHISGYPVYSLETRDAATLKLLKSTEFEEIDNPVQNCPRIIGHDDKIIWIFRDKLIAFDAFSHEIVCTKEKLEQLSPVLKDNLPDDIQYYKYNYILGRLEITSKNALHFQISKSYKAQKIDENDPEETEEIVEFKAIKEKLEAERSEMTKTLDKKNYDDYMKLYDSIRKIDDIVSNKKEEIRNNKEYNNKIQESRTRGFDYAYDRLENAAIVDSTIYALLSDKDLKEYNGYFYFRRIYSEDVQRSLYQSTFTELEKNSGFNSRCKIKEWKQVNNANTFLKGGFLANKENLANIEFTDPQCWLILTSKEVGNKSKLILQRVNIQGIAVWTKELPIINFGDMVLAGDNLILFSNDGEKITGSSENNWIISVNLKTGEFVMLDLGKEE